MILKIRVTKDCIENGKRFMWSCCPVALALKDIFPEVTVSESILYPFGFKERPYSQIDLPVAAISFIQWFDAYNSGNPFEFEFEIDIPDSVIEKINIDEVKSLLVNHKNLELV